MTKSDLIIVGAGPGGYETAIAAAKAGLSVVLIESRKVVGGTCLNEGCIPTKSFCRNAEILDTLKQANSYGVSQLRFEFDFSKVITRKNEVVETLNIGVATLLKHKLITQVTGKAQFEDTHTVRVDNAVNTEGDRVETHYSAPHIIIATGSITKYLPIEGVNLPGVVTSTELLDIQKIPTHLCIIGGGVIGLEFASIFNSFGSQVTVVEFCKEILPNFDSDIAKRLKQSLKSKGINFVNQAAVTAINKKDNALSVTYTLKGETVELEADCVLMAVGRVPNLNSLNLDEAGITYTHTGIVVNENMQTNLQGVYAIGDINGKCMLAHAATFQGTRALNHILGRTDAIRFDIIPSAVFTSPEAAMVGKTEEQCKNDGIKFGVKKAFFRANGKALAMHESEGMAKIIANEEGKLLGCHLFGAHAADLVQEIAALMHKEATIDDLKAIIHGHPTLGEVIQSAAHEF